MKNKKKVNTEIFLLVIIVILSGTLASLLIPENFQKEQQPVEIEEIEQVEQPLDQISVLPYWRDGIYHDYYDTVRKIVYFNDEYPHLVYLFSIGKSAQGKEIWCIRITNENTSHKKYSCLIDGCIHGNEWEAGELCIYLAEYLLINFGKNSTVTNILNTSEIYIVPLLNPDGRQSNTRWNDNGIDLNRNFDVDFGKFMGRSLRIGKLFGRIKIPQIWIPFISRKVGAFSNCGRNPFSEPETEALSDLMKTLNYNDFSFYVNCHTALHNIVTPWMVYKPPFKMTKDELDLYDYVESWVYRYTEYEVANREKWKFYSSGNVMDWCFKEFRVPSFTYEVLPTDYDPWFGSFQEAGKHDRLVYWMKASLPFFLYLLMNIENLHQWEIPNIEPSLPEDVPPEYPLSQ